LIDVMSRNIREHYDTLDDRDTAEYHLGCAQLAAWHFECKMKRLCLKRKSCKNNHQSRQMKDDRK